LITSINLKDEVIANYFWQDLLQHPNALYSPAIIRKIGQNLVIPPHGIKFAIRKNTPNADINRPHPK